MSSDESHAMAPDRSGSEQAAEDYYDSRDADAFYERIWGGEDIHIGLYDDGDASIREASRRTVELLASRLGRLAPGVHVVDLGAGYGGAARLLAGEHGCRVTCVNLSDRQNQRNRELCSERGLAGRVEVRHESFEAVGLPDGCADVVWSQDAFLHAGDRARVLRECHRLLRAGGELIFTDPMETDDCPPGVLRPVYERIHLDSLGSFAFYRKTLAQLGFEEVECRSLTAHLRHHYERVGRELRRRYDELAGDVSRGYLDRMLRGLSHWVRAADEGHLAWGFLHFRRC